MEVSTRLKKENHDIKNVVFFFSLKFTYCSIIGYSGRFDEI